MTNHRFYETSVLSILDASPKYDESLEAHVSVEIHGSTAVVELTPVENGEVLIGTETFRVTVERIEATR